MRLRFGRGVTAAIVAAMVRSWIARGYITQSVVIVGVNEVTSHLVDRFRSNRYGIRIAGVFDDRSDNRTNNSFAMPVSVSS